MLIDIFLCMSDVDFLSYGKRSFVAVRSHSLTDVLGLLACCDADFSDTRRSWKKKKKENKEIGGIFQLLNIRLRQDKTCTIHESSRWAPRSSAPSRAHAYIRLSRLPRCPDRPRMAISFANGQPRQKHEEVDFFSSHLVRRKSIQRGILVVYATIDGCNISLEDRGRKRRMVHWPPVGILWPIAYLTMGRIHFSTQDRHRSIVTCVSY